MSSYPSHELQRETYHEWRSYLNQFPWEWMTTLTFRDETNYDTAQRHFRRWRLRLIDEEKLRIGCYLLSSYKKGRIHLHALLLGRNRYSKTLLDCSIRTWESRWYPGYARIKKVESNFRACDYVSLHFMGFKSDHAQADYYDGHLLKQEMEGNFYSELW